MLQSTTRFIANEKALKDSWKKEKIENLSILLQGALAAEGMVIMGQVARGYGVDDVKVGAAVELVVETLFEDDDHEYTVWKWKPVSA